MTEDRPLAPDSPQLADEAATWRCAYVHVPFCRRRCPYCDFAVVTPDERPAGVTVADYVGAVIAEIAMEPLWGPLAAVNIGGGTPSTLEPEAVAQILGVLRRRYDLVADAEISVEANPEDVTPALAAALADAGVTRISLGVQSLDGDVLRTLGRAHDAATAAAAMTACREAGIASTSIDLIFGTPGESLVSWLATVDGVLAMGPDHLSTYALTVERGTALSRTVLAGGLAPDPDLQADMYEAAAERGAAGGLVRYEISNYAAPGHACRYNLATWAQGEYLAFGVGAHGHRRGVRRRNLRRLDRYLEAVVMGRRPEAGRETITGWAAEQERLLLGLRRTAGVRVGAGGRTLLASAEGRRLVDADVLTVRDGRLVVRRPLLADAVNRAVVALEDPPDGASAEGSHDLSLSGGDC